MVGGNVVVADIPGGDSCSIYVTLTTTYYVIPSDSRGIYFDRYYQFKADPSAGSG